MALVFPPSPTVGEIFTSPDNIVWMWDGAKWTATPSDMSYLPISGGTMTGDLTLAADPVNPLDAATKDYVDDGDDAIWGTGGLMGGYINKIRNPGFEIWQRGNVTAPANNTVYTADGWQVTTAGAACAVALGGKIAGSVGSRSITLAAASGLTTCNLLQRIESYVAAHLGGRVCTLQAYINNNTSNPITPQLIIYYPTVADTFTSVGTEVPLTNLQTIPANSVGRICYTFNASPNAIYGYQVVLQFGGALNGTSGSIVIADVDLRSTPNLSLGLNSSPPLVEIRPIGIELGYCHRYFQWLPFNMYWAATIGQHCSTIYFPTMRATPTISTLVADPNTTATVTNNATNGFSYVTPYSAALAMTAITTSGAVTYVLGYRASASAEL